ncbi:MULTISPECIES: site-specific integrase [Pseudomonas]|uniref:site-specific integrase n=1 Tax=Pseudomonas TaxID=286 RepID=UPI00049B4C14|nr:MULTISPECIES: site-specific integrase [Pseudomonas]AHZ75171.1 integrase [Pseudomonas putida]QUN68452.1 site-specific integrase [Pseudomonas sp. JS425]
MKTKFTAKLLAGIQPQEKPYRIHDTAQPGLSIRVLPSGHASYMVSWGRNQAATLGRVGMMTLDQARTEAARWLAEAHEHGAPLVATKNKRRVIHTLESYLTESYYPWLETHHKAHQKTRHAIEHSFTSLMAKPLSDLNQRDLEAMRVKWLAAGLKEATANRKLAALRGALSKAVEWGVIETHPMTKLKPLRLDTRGRVRFLSGEEEQRLRKALENREERIRRERDTANQWRQARKKDELPDLRKLTFADHLKPMTIISLNTGLRRGELFNLTWADIDIQRRNLTVVGDSAKSDQTRHIPLNTEALHTICEWQKQSTDSGRLFPSQTGGRMDNVKKSWDGVLKAAEISSFRWHDLRHTFASKLAMRGVPLNTIRDLLGHADLKMTLRYAHLAPDTKAAAVELL